MALAVETNALRRTFGDFVAVDDIDLEVPVGSFFGFLGLNGAGKSTTIKCLNGLLRPSSGTVKILGLDALDDSIAVRRRVGVVPEDLALFDRLSATENLTFVGRAHGLSRSIMQERIRELLEIMELDGAAGKLVTDYSHGMRKKLSLACALLPSPQLLFLDEPFEGVDAAASRHLRQLLQRFVERGGTVFLTSHVLAIVEGLCNHVGVIHNGQLIAQGSFDDLRHSQAGAADHTDAAPSGRSLEELFLDLVGADEDDRSLDWLGS